MVRRSSLLDTVQIAHPCPAAWESMTGDDRAHHCPHCRLDVYNLSAMTVVARKGAGGVATG